MKKFIISGRKFGKTAARNQELMNLEFDLGSPDGDRTFFTVETVERAYDMMSEPGPWMPTPEQIRLAVSLARGRMVADEYVMTPEETTGFVRQEGHLPVMVEDYKRDDGYRPAKGHPNKIKGKKVRAPVWADLCDITAAECNEFLASLPPMEPL